MDGEAFALFGVGCVVFDWVGERERVSERIVPLGSSWREGAQTVESAFTVTNRRNKRLNLSRS